MRKGLLNIILVCVMACAFVGVCKTTPVDAASYSVWIGGTQVTSSNCNNLATNKWKYDNATKTLTLNGYTYSGAGKKFASPYDEDDPATYAGIYSKSKLNIVLVGGNTITVKSPTDYSIYGIFCLGDLTINGSGSLNVSTASCTSTVEYYSTVGIEVYGGNMTVNDGYLGVRPGTSCDSRAIVVGWGDEDWEETEEEIFDDEEYDEEDGEEDWEWTCEPLGEFILNKGTVYATGGTATEDDGVPYGIEAEYIDVYGGTLSATGGAATKCSEIYSCGINGTLRMNGGTVQAIGGTAIDYSYGICGTDCIVAGGVLKATGGSAKTSYGISAMEYESGAEEDYEVEEDYDTYSAYIYNDARMTLSGKTAASADFVSWLSTYYLDDNAYVPYIKYSTNADGSSSKILVNPEPGDKTITESKYLDIRPATTPKNFSLSAEEVVLTIANPSKTLTVTISGDYEYKEVNWDIEDPEIATCDSTGKLTAVDEGETILYVCVGSVIKEVKVTVDLSYVVESISIDKHSHTFNSIGEELKLNAKVSPDGFDEDFIAWESSDEDVVSVNENGVITAEDYGKATITVSYEDDNEKYVEDFCYVSVVNRDMGEIEEDLENAHGTCGDDLEWRITEDRVLEITGSGEMEDYTTTSGNKCAPWNNYASYITDIVIDEDVTHIGKNAFSGIDYTGVKFPELPKWLYSVGDHAFDSIMCDARGFSITLPNRLTHIGKYAFANNNISGTLTIPVRINNIEEGAFEGCSGITSLVFATYDGVNNYAYLDEEAFAYCASLKNVKFSSNIGQIGDCCFLGCTSLETITFPESVRNIGNCVLAHCINLSDVIIEGASTKVGYGLLEETNQNNIIMVNPNSREMEALKQQYNDRVSIIHEHDENGRVITSEGGFRRIGLGYTCCSVCKKKGEEFAFASVDQDFMTVTKATYTGAEIKPQVIVKSTTFDGVTVLTEGKDYTVEYSDNIEIGTASVKVVLMGDYKGNRTDYFKIEPVDLKATDCTLSKSQFTYNGKSQMPTVVSENIPDSEYSVIYEDKPSSIGDHYVRILGKNNHTGELLLKYSITPPTSSISKLAKGKKTMSVKWKKITKNISGYQIQYSKSSKFEKGNKTTTIKGYKTYSKKFKKLAKGKYYVRVRTYKSVGSGKFYSVWSKAKSVKVS